MKRENEKGEEIKGIDKELMKLFVLTWLWGAICGLAMGYLIF